MKLKLFTKLLFAASLLVTLSACLEDVGNVAVRTQADEDRELEAYLEGLVSEGHDIDTTELGIFYVYIEDGEGPFPVDGDTLQVGYAGYFVDGNLFDSSELHDPTGTFEFILGNPPMIEGWDDGMKVINKGAKVQLIIPSKYGYGEFGAGNIPPYQTLVFVIKMKDINP